MNKIATIVLAQNKHLPGKKQLHKSFFLKELKKKEAHDIEVYERTDPVRYLKWGDSLYRKKSPVYSVVNTAGVRFEFTRRFGNLQLLWAEELFLKQAIVCYPRIIFFEAPDPDSEEQLILDKLSAHYRMFREAGIAIVSASEEKALGEILKMLELVRNT